MSKDTQSVENAAVCFLECSPAQLCMRVFYCTASGIFVTPVSCGHHLCSLHPSLHRSHNSACPYLPAAPPGPAVLLFPAVACVVTLWAGVSCEQQSNKASASDKGSPWKRKALSILPAILPCLKQHWSWVQGYHQFVIWIRLTTDGQQVGWAECSWNVISIGKNKYIYIYKSWCSEWKFSFPNLFNVEQFRLLKQMKCFYK